MVGAPDGTPLGDDEGAADGSALGETDEETVGGEDGLVEGEGEGEGCAVLIVGLGDGNTDGDGEGGSEGRGEGSFVAGLHSTFSDPPPPTMRKGPIWSPTTSGTEHEVCIEQ